MPEVTAGEMDQRITWLNPPGTEGITPPDNFTEDPPPPALWTEWTTTWAKVEHVPVTRANATGAGKPQEVYRVTMRLLPGISPANVGRWQQPGGGDANIHLAVESVTPAQRSGTQVVIAVQVADPDVGSGAVPC